MKRIASFVFGLALVLASLPAHAAASTQTAHAWLCQPRPAGGAAGPQRIVNPNTNVAYSLNGAGCALIASGDVGWALSQGFTYGPNTFTLIQTGITASTTSSTSTITLPASAVITMVVLAETAGHSITGGVDIGDSTSATEYASAVALGANATVTVADSALTRLDANSGAPAAFQILVACHTSCNSGSINITILYSYF
jgi:hypothetical protein